MKWSRDMQKLREGWAYGPYFMYRNPMTWNESGHTKSKLYWVTLGGEVIDNTKFTLVDAKRFVEQHAAAAAN